MDLCADCVAKQLGGSRTKPFAICCTCGRAVVPITMHRRAAEPFLRRMWGAFAFPLGTVGIISLFFIGFVRALTSYTGAAMMTGGAAFVLRQGLYWAFIFFTIRSVANGQRRMGMLDFSDLHSDIIAPAGKGVLSTAILWLPALVYVYLAADNGLAGLLTYAYHEDAAVWLLVLLGGLYAPMALLAAATDLGYGHILNPVFIGVSIVRIGKDYVLAVVAMGMVLLLGMAATALVEALLGLLPIPFMGRWLSMTVGLYAPFVAAGFLGNLLYLHGEVLDWGRSEEYEIPLLPGVEPRGQYRPKPPPKADAEPHAPWPVVPRPGSAPAPGPGPAPGSPSELDVTNGLVSLLNLSGSPLLDAGRSGSEVEPPLELDAGIVVPPAAPLAALHAPAPGASVSNLALALPAALLEAQAFYASEAPFPVDLPPAPPSVPAAPAPAAATVLAQATPAPPGAAAPTMLGFSPALPAAESAATRLGHAAVRPEPAPTETKKR
jgi:hypothetical protein